MSFTLMPLNGCMQISFRILVSFTSAIFNTCMICIIIRMVFNQYKPSVLFNMTKANSADPDRTPQDAVSNQGLHCLLTKCIINI